MHGEGKPGIVLGSSSKTTDAAGLNISCSWSERVRSCEQAVHTHTHKVRDTTHSPACCALLADVYAVTCYQHGQTRFQAHALHQSCFFLLVLLLPCSGLLQQAAWVRKKETSSGRRQTTFILASHFSTTRSVNNLDPAESLIKRLLSAPIATFGWLKLLLLSQGVPHRGKDSNDGERYHQLQLTSSSSIWFHLQ